MALLLERLLCKPKDSFSVQILSGQILTFGGSHQPSCVITMITIGRRTTELNKKFIQVVMSEMEAQLGILPTLSYIYFVDSTPIDVFKREQATLL
jgi:hypothetical protein